MAEPQRRNDASPISASAHFLIVEGRFYDDINDMLLSGATTALTAAGATFDVVQMPGALEVPTAIAIRLEASRASGPAYAGAVALGCIVRGETYHFEIVANESARGLMALAVQERFPLGNGILTVEDDTQARVRADPEQGNKGGEAAQAMLALWRLKQLAGVPS